MKRYFLPFLLLFCLFLSSCFDIEEIYTLNADGSYKVQFNFDMSEVMKMAGPYMGDSVTQGANSKKDTAFIIGKAIPDSIKGKFSARELMLLNKTMLQVKMDMSNEIMKTSLTNEGKSYDDLQYFLKNFNEITKKANLTKMLDPKSKLSGDDPSAGMELPVGNGDFDYLINATVFERKAKAKKEDAGDEMGEAGLEMLSGMGIKLTHTLIVNLPGKVKEVNDPAAIISPDRKQVKIVTDIMENRGKLRNQHLLINY